MKLEYAKYVHAQGLKRVMNEPVPEGSKFKPGDRVYIADDLGSWKSHFPSGRMATVEYNYAHAYGGSNVRDYSLNVDGFGSSSWYDESELTLTP